MLNILVPIVIDLAFFVFIVADNLQIKKDIETLYDNYSKLLQESIERNIKGENKNA